MKVFMGYHCAGCGIDFDVDSRNLKHAEPKCSECGCDDKIKRIYANVDEDEEEIGLW